MLIDVTRLVGHRLIGRLPTGVDRVSLEYVRHFGHAATALVRVAGRWLELPRRDSEAVFGYLLSPLRGPDPTIVPPILSAYFFRWGGSGKDGRVLLNTGHSGLIRKSYARRLRQGGFKPVFFLHDIIPITHAEYCRPGEAERHHLRLATMLSTGAGLIANSAATLSALEVYAQKRGIALPPKVAALLAPASMPESSGARPHATPYFVVLGTIEPRKNHLLLLNLWRSLARDLGENTPALVVIGQRGWENEQIIDMLERCESLRGHVFEISRCSDAELAAWLRHAQALLFPSFAEGYGMPLAEALALGLPAIASDLPAFREFAGDIPEYLDPLDGARWRDMVLAYAEDSHPLRLAQLERMRDFRVPTWKEHFSRVEALLDGMA